MVDSEHGAQEVESEVNWDQQQSKYENIVYAGSRVMQTGQL